MDTGTTTAIKTSYEAIPSELRSLPRWVTWTEEDRDGKRTKVPYDAATGRRAATNNPSTWCEFPVALGALKDSRYAGLGFVFNERDPCMGIDLDHCRDPRTGEIEARAAETVRDLNSYTEISPSGEGLHIIVNAKLPPGRRRRGGVEVYDCRRYFTMTGQHLDGTPLVVESRQLEVEQLHAKLVAGAADLLGRDAGAREDERDAGAGVREIERDAGARERNREVDVTSVFLSDADVIVRAAGAKNGDKFRRLWAGEVTGYPSHSEADCALCSLIAFWVGPDPGRIDRVFRQSGLFRPKWDEVHYADGSTHGQGTIRTALQEPREYYRAGHRGDSGDAADRDTAAEASSEKYVATPNGLIMLKHTKLGPVPVPLTNFTAKIIGNEFEDDGEESRLRLVIEASLRGRVRRFTVPASQFASMNWVTEHLGGGAIVYGGVGTKDQTRVAIQLLSGDIPEHRVYTHTGWRKIDDDHLYLHGGGAIGRNGKKEGVEVILPRALSDFILPEPAAPDVVRRAVQSSLSFLDVAPLRVTVPLYAGVWRAPLGPCDFSVHISGPTGAGKSEAAALPQQHYGSAMTSRRIPCSWASTGNALESSAFSAKDAVLTVDDFAPTGSTTDVQRQHRDADRVLRAQGNQSGRQRMRSDTTLRAARQPRGLIVSTGEDVPRGQSLRARILVLELGPKDMDWARLTACQHSAADGTFAQALAGYIRWLAADYDRIHRELRREVEALRERAMRSSAHRRTPEIVANLALGIRYFLAYAQSVGAVTAVDVERIWARAWDAIADAASAQAQHQQASEPARRFIELVSGALANGMAHVAAIDGSEPDRPEACGWRRAPGDHISGPIWHPQGRRIGWIKGGSLYLVPDAAYAIVQELGGKVGDSLNLQPRTLNKRLAEAGLLVSSDIDRKTHTVRLTVEGRRQDVLHLPASTLDLSTVLPPDQPDHSEVAIDSGTVREVGVVVDEVIDL